MKRIASLLLAFLLTSSPCAIPQTLTPNGRATFTASTNIVVVNVTVLDRNGKPIENLTRDDFQLTENGKAQKLQAVDLQRLRNQKLPTIEQELRQRAADEAKPKGFNPEAETAAAARDPKLSKYQDRRLMVMLFDLSSMQAAEQIRAKQAAEKFLRTQMTGSDMVSIMAFGSELKTVQDFTSDRDLLLDVIDRFRVGDSSENAGIANTGTDAQDQSGTFTADESEFNIFNADLKLSALQDAARQLAQFPEKKALIYISSGIEKNGVDNQSQLEATVNTAVRANVAFYPIDARGLTALVPGGDATQQGATGTGLFSGSGQRSVKENFNNQQETLATLALQTGGKALLDSNDLSEGIRQVQSDFTSYYILSYVSTDPTPNGRYRKIQVKLAPSAEALKAKLNYRQGYYAPTTFAKMQDSDKESQLSQALLSDNPLTDLPIAVEVDYFRLDRDKYFTPIAVKIPGSALQFQKKGAKQATELDFIADVFDSRNRTAATVRDTVPLKIDGTTADLVTQKSVQYDTGVTLTPGSYRIRFVARENGEGKVGTFETKFVIPDLTSSKTLRYSALVLSNQRQAVTESVGGVKNDKKLTAANPLIEAGQKLVPNVTKVFRPGQSMLVYLEVYDPTIPSILPETFRVADVQASLAFYSASKKVFQTDPIRVSQLFAGRTGTLPVRITVPLAPLAPGRYSCQLNLIDELGHKFAFPRKPFALVAAPASGIPTSRPAPSSVSPTGGGG